MSAGSASVSANRHRHLWFATSAGILVLSVAAIKLALHLYAGSHYGYFIDELYYLACGEHLAWGYVDQPPLIAVIAWATRATLGGSLPAIRLIPAAAGAGVVILTGLIARELGGRTYAQFLASLSALMAPGFLAMDGFLSMNAFEPLFWMGCAYIFIRIVKTGNQKLWLWFGLLAGFGLENKYSMLIFGAGLVLGMILSSQRRSFLRPWIWIGGGIALLIFLPNLLWNIQHHFPFLELQANIHRIHRNVALSPAVFFGEEILIMLPLTLPVWLAGLWFYFFEPDGKPFRALGWAWIFAAAVIVFLNPRIYYLLPAFPLLLAAGGVLWERWLNARAKGRIAYAALIAICGIVLMPLAIPVLPVETYIRYSRALHLHPPTIENNPLGPLPQLYADQFGWEEMAATVARVYNRLPPQIRTKTAIFGQNYGQAGAIDLFGPKYGLPKAISAHQSYFLWGPRDYTGESMIVLDDRQERLEQLFESVEKVAHVGTPYSMPSEHFDVYYCKGMKQPLRQIWPKIKMWN
ncbi:MAG TPA: glycosyltransferase family 39 protein [Bryobacteraceae bacterium]|nr:glycosyltransferase family 39 protein [Bryobacteraceae bacterium]